MTGRTNQNGHPCPPWCQTDHTFVHGEAGTFDFHGGEILGVFLGRDQFGARAIDDGTGRGHPSVLAGAQDKAHPSLWLTPPDADRLADLIDILASATPAQVRKIAEAVRGAARTVLDASAIPHPPEVLP